MSDLTPSSSQVGRPQPQRQAPIKVLVITDNPTATVDALKNLRKLGLDVMICLFDGSKIAAIPREAPGAVLCFFTDYIEKTASSCRVVRDHYAPKTPPIIGALFRPTESSTDHFDTVLFAPMHSSQIANRVNAMIRLGDMESEITRRISTLREDFGQDVSLTAQDLNRPFRILFVGKAAPGFMVVNNALQSAHVEVVAAFTSFSAFDYLHERTFDAVVMNAMEESEPALTISETMRRNARLYHVPTLYLVNEEPFRDRDAAYEHGANDIVPVTAPLEEIRGRIMELANYHRIHEQLKLGFGSLGGDDCLDTDSGAFNREFFAAHMPRVISDCQRKAQPLALIALRPVPSMDLDLIDPAFLNAGIAKLGGMFKSMVRMQDVTTRFDKNTYLIAFPGATEPVVASIIERMRNMADCAAFDAGISSKSNFTFRVESSVVTASRFDDIDTLVEQLLQSLPAESVETSQARSA